MAAKEVYLFDDSNNPLKVIGIRLELFDSASGLLLDVQLSDNRNPHLLSASTEWGADLTFTPGGNPVDIYINDPAYTYPGNAVEYLNGQTNDRVDIDLKKLPVTPIGTSTPTSTLDTLIPAIKANLQWSVKEKQAVLNFVYNYMKLVSKATVSSPELTADQENLVANWNESLNRLGIDPETLRLGVPALAVF